MKQVLAIAILAVLLWICYCMIRWVEKYYIKKLPQNCLNYSFEISGIKALSRLTQVIALFIFGLILLGILHIPISGLVTVGGVGGIAAAYAGKDTLSNFLGGIMNYLNRQFAINDQISSPDRDIKGIVENMGWRYTVIRRDNGETMYVPNSIFASIMLINASRLKPTGEKP